MTLKKNMLWERAKDDHLFLNDIKDSCAREFIIAMFHKIEDLEVELNDRRLGDETD